MNKIYLLLLVLVCSITINSIQAQSLKRYKTEAGKATDAKDYAHSLKYYLKMIDEAEDKNVDNYYQAAESARNFRLPSLAEKYYKEVLKDSIGRNRYRLTHFHLGTVQKSQGHYSDAINSFQHYIDHESSFESVSYKRKAEKEIKDCHWADTVKITGPAIVHLDTTVNSPNSEFGPYERDSILYYSSVRYPTNNRYEAVPPLARIYTSENQQLGTEIQDDFNESIQTHTAHTTFNPGGTRMYYTICENINALDVRCKIYYRDKEGNVWKARDSLSSAINLEGYTATQPSVGYDNYSKKEVLFFVSDRPTDTSDVTKDLNIWCSFMDEDGNFGAPAYIAACNSIEEDVTPFFHTASQTLYFSSNGRKNMGGFDIYSLRKNGAGWETVKHMGAPLNSSSDEMYYTINSQGSYGYMSSNRPGGSCAPNDSLCVCNDIYKIPQLSVQVRTFHKLNGEPLFGTTVALLDKILMELDTQSKADDHQYDYFVGFDRDYHVDGTKTRWIPDEQSFTTKGSSGGEKQIIDLYLTPEIDVDVFTFDKLSGEPLNGCKVELYAIAENGETVFIGGQKKLQNIQYNFDLEFFKKFMIVGSKDEEGYTRDTSYRTITIDIPLVPTTLTDNLYLCKKPVLPENVNLYFFNDEPVPRSRDTVSNISYTGAKDSYLIHRNKFDRAFSYDKKMLDAIEIFFKDTVIGGYKRLDTLSNILNCYLTQLGEGDELSVVVAGYASPLAKNDYNLNLTKRRIDSIYKFFRENLNGVTEEQFSRLKIKVEPKGEEFARKGISDNRKRPRESIYSLKASRERRVEITGLELNGNRCTVPCEYTSTSKY